MHSDYNLCMAKHKWGCQWRNWYLSERGIEKKISDIHSFNERILISHFQGNPIATVIVHYAPTEGNTHAEEDYKNLANAVNDIPKHNLLLVLGDYNAHIGKNSTRHTYHENTDSNRIHLLQFAERKGLNSKDI